MKCRFKKIKISKFVNIEALIWLTALIYLTYINPDQPRHFDLCLFGLMGIENCPGCGLGRSISLLFHGELIASFKSHPLGIPAIILIGKRIFQLTKNKMTTLTQNTEVING